MKLVDQWARIEAGLPADWDDVRLTLRTEQSTDLARAAQVLGSMNAGRVGEALVLHVRRAGGSSAPEGARRLFALLDDDRVWCELDVGEVVAGEAAAAVVEDGLSARSQWLAALRTLPTDWSDIECEIAVASSDLLPRVALLCAPVNPTRDTGMVAFSFRCARHAGYGVSPSMAERCFERVDNERISVRIAVRGVLCETDNVGTQGPVVVSR